MKQILTRIELFRKAAARYKAYLLKHGYNILERVVFFNAIREGIALGDSYPDWISYSERKPKKGDKILVYLDDDTIASYTCGLLHSFL